MMQKTQMKKLLSLILCMVLIAAMALFVTGCSDKTDEAALTTTVYESGSVIGEGDTSFTFTVSDIDGNESVFEVKTDRSTVGDALLDTGIIAGEDGEFGLYVKEVNGITADFDTDGTYWAFYINGEYAMTGVDTTEIDAGAAYAFKVEK